MNLNYQKCVNLTTNRKTSAIKFKDGSLVPRQRHATYLGTILTDTASNMAEIQNRLAKATKTCAQLKLFWDKAHTHTPVLHGNCVSLIQSSYPNSCMDLKLYSWHTDWVEQTGFVPSEMHSSQSPNSPNIRWQNANKSICKGPCQQLQRRHDRNFCCLEKTKTQATWAHTSKGSCWPA